MLDFLLKNYIYGNYFIHGKKNSKAEYIEILSVVYNIL